MGGNKAQNIKKKRAWVDSPVNPEDTNDSINSCVCATNWNKKRFKKNDEPWNRTEPHRLASRPRHSSGSAVVSDRNNKMTDQLKPTPRCSYQNQNSKEMKVWDFTPLGHQRTQRRHSQTDLRPHNQSNSKPLGIPPRTIDSSQTQTTGTGTGTLIDTPNHEDAVGLLIKIYKDRLKMLNRMRVIQARLEREQKTLDQLNRQSEETREAKRRNWDRIQNGDQVCYNLTKNVKNFRNFISTTRGTNLSDDYQRQMSRSMDPELNFLDDEDDGSDSEEDWDDGHDEGQKQLLVNPMPQQQSRSLTRKKTEHAEQMTNVNRLSQEEMNQFNETMENFTEDCNNYYDSSESSGYKTDTASGVNDNERGIASVSGRFVPRPRDVDKVVAHIEKAIQLDETLLIPPSKSKSLSKRENCPHCDKLLTSSYLKIHLRVWCKNSPAAQVTGGSSKRKAAK